MHSNIASHQVFTSHLINLANQNDDLQTEKWCEDAANHKNFRRALHYNVMSSWEETFFILFSGLYLFLFFK